MGLFDKIKDQANSIGGVASQAASKISGGRKSISFETLESATLAGFTALPQATLQSPYDTAAMIVIALNCYIQNKDEGVAMINYLKGPAPLSAHDLSLIKMQLTDYLARSYFAGATPENDYMPSQPYTVVVSDNPYSYATQGYTKLFVHCGGADTPRPVIMRLAKDGKWYLDEFGGLLSGCRKPESTNPWA